MPRTAKKQQEKMKAAKKKKQKTKNSRKTMTKKQKQSAPSTKLRSNKQKQKASTTKATSNTQKQKALSLKSTSKKQKQKASSTTSTSKKQKQKASSTKTTSKTQKQKSSSIKSSSKTQKQKALTVKSVTQKQKQTNSNEENNKEKQSCRFRIKNGNDWMMEEKSNNKQDNSHNKNHKTTISSSKLEDDESTNIVAEMREPPKKKRKFNINLFDDTEKLQNETRKPSRKPMVAKNVKKWTDLNTALEFNDVQINFWLGRLSVIPGKRLILFGIAENHIIVLSGAAKTILHHQDLKINQWYHLRGAKVEVYKGTKQIQISAHSTFAALDGVAKPEIDFSRNNNIVQDFKSICTIQENLRTQYYIGGIVDEIGKPERLGDKKRIIITVRDVNGVGIDVYLWHSQDHETSEKMKINNTIILTGWKLTTGSTVALHNNGLMLINQDLPKPTITNNLVHNLSVLDYDEIAKTTPTITVSEALSAALGQSQIPHTNTGFFILRNVKVINISNIFSFKDATGNRLEERVGGMVLDHRGFERELDLNKDLITYYLRFTLQEVGNSKRVLFVTGFEEAGMAIFNMSANALYEKMKDDESIDVAYFVEKLSETGFDFMVSTYITKQQKVSWTFNDVRNMWILDDQPLN